VYGGWFMVYGGNKKAPEYSGALNVFVLNLTVTKLVINRVLHFVGFGLSDGIWILNVCDRAGRMAGGFHR